MILCDYSQTMIACVAAEIGFSGRINVTEDLLRHMILNSLRASVSKFKGDYGELVLAVDARDGYWRKQDFPYYKAKRVKAKKESSLDWNSIYRTLDSIRAEFEEHMPYKIVGAPLAEADDVIAVLTQEISKTEKVLILSADKDYIQLHTDFSDRVQQWDPIRKKWVTDPDPEKYLLMKIIKGDAGDGIPNIRMSGDCFVTGVRQKPVTEKFIAEFIANRGQDTALEENFARNERLIDFRNIPEVITSAIMQSYEEQPEKGRGKMLNYFIQKRLRNLSQSLGDF